MVQQQQQEEVDDMQHGPFPVEQLQVTIFSTFDTSKGLRVFFNLGLIPKWGFF